MKILKQTPQTKLYCIIIIFLRNTNNTILSYLTSSKKKVINYSDS